MNDNSNAENFYSKENKLPEDTLEFNVEEGSDGIALLVSMAKAGKIDPWNIDIVDVTDKYLVQMAEKKAYNLRNTGRTIWLASVLLKLKSNVLVGLDPMDFDSIMSQENFEEYDDNFEAEYEQKPIRKNNVVSIDEALKRRLSTRLNRKRTVTLQDLIKQLKFYEELDKKQALKNSFERSKNRIRNYHSFSAKDFLNHDDNRIKKTIEQISTKLEKIFIKNEKVELNDLVDVGMEKISAYMALLFLTADNKVDLYQQEIYGNLYVQKANSEVILSDNSNEEQKSEQTDNAKEKSIEQDIYFKDKTMKFGGMQANIIKAIPIKEAVVAS